MEAKGKAMKLSEILFNEAAVPFSEIGKSEMALKLIKNDDMILFILYRPSVLTKYFQTWESTDGLTVGMMHIVLSEDSNKIYEVKASAAEQGYGPTLYDIVMSYIAPKYLMADRKEVSDAARNVWRYMFDNRKAEYDVLAVPEEGKWKTSESEDIPFLNQAYRLKKKLSIYSTLVLRDKQFFANQLDRNKRSQMLTTLEEDAWTYFRDRMH